MKEKKPLSYTNTSAMTGIILVALGLRPSLVSRGPSGDSRAAGLTQPNYSYNFLQYNGTQHY